MQLAIVTGASRGLGLALAQQLLGRDRQLLTISRKPDPALAQRAQQQGASLEQWALDVAAPDAAPRLEAWLSGLDAHAFDRAVLINNAGVIGNVGPLERMDAPSISQVLRVNFEAAALLCAAFLRATRKWRAERRVLNVSSGAGRVAIAGWAAYCAAKAALDQLSRVMTLDEALLPNPAKIVSLAPGVIDTDMQTQLRESDERSFPTLSRFKEFKATGQLAPPAEAAVRLITYLERKDFGANPVADVRSD